MTTYQLTALKRLMWVILFYTFFRMLFLAFNTSIFLDNAPNDWGHIAAAFLFGLRFDVSIALYLNSLFLLLSFLPLPLQNFRVFRYLSNICFWIPNILAFTANQMDMVYFRFTGKRATADIFDFVAQGGGFTDLFGQFLHDFWPEMSTTLAMLLLFIWAVKHYAAWPKSHIIFRFRQFVLSFVVFLVFIAVWGIGARGGLQLKPINIIDAVKVAPAKYTALVINTPFSIGKTIGRSTLKPQNTYSEDILEDIYSPLHHPEQNTQRNDSLNVLIIIVESLSSEYCGFMNPTANNPSFTPFLDSLSKACMSFRGFANGKRSIEGIPAILASLPSLMHQEFITSPYAANRIEGLGSLLAKEGYHTAFFHGGKNGTMGFESFASAAGFQEYYGLDQYPDLKDFDGKWGIFDEPYLQYVATKLSEFPEPFLASVFTLSSHHPYTIPEQYKGRFPKGNLKILESIAYTDFALSKFFEQISKEKWFQNSLIVLTADHTSKSEHPYYQNRTGMYEIPILFYMPNGTLPTGRQKGIAQQSDIHPTILSLAGYPNPYIAFGQSLPNKNGMAINFLNESYQIIQDSLVGISDGNHIISLFNRKKDSMMQHNILAEKQKNAKQLDSLLKAIIQQYNNRMINNKIHYQNEY